MAAAPYIKVFNPKNEYIASCKHFEDAACLVAFNGDGSTIRIGHTKNDIVWTEGAEEQRADESYDYVVETCHGRAQARRDAREAAYQCRNTNSNVRRGSKCIS